jgi:hypothetical protein
MQFRAISYILASILFINAGMFGQVLEIDDTFKYPDDRKKHIACCGTAYEESVSGELVILTIAIGIAGTALIAYALVNTPKNKDAHSHCCHRHHRQRCCHCHCH